MRRNWISLVRTLVAIVVVAGCTSLPPALDTAYRRVDRGLEVTSIGHATFLLDFDGFVVLTDPWFHEVPLSGTHPEPLGLSPSRLPSPALILATHGHRSLRQAVPAGSAGEARSGHRAAVDRAVCTRPRLLHGPRPRGVASHPRRSRDRHRRPRRALRRDLRVPHRGADKVVLFVAETTFFPDLRRVAERFRRIDVAFLPADGLTLRWGRRLAMDGSVRSGRRRRCPASAHGDPDPRSRLLTLDRNRRPQDDGHGGRVQSAARTHASGHRCRASPAWRPVDGDPRSPPGAARMTAPVQYPPALRSS